LVSLIVVNMNGRLHLEGLLTSLREQDFPAEQLELVLVDNGSLDGSAAFVEAAWPGAVIIRNAENRGFAPANNQGAAVANGRYLAFVNNDMKVAPDWLSRLVTHRRAASDDTVCIASKILNWDGTHLDFAGGTIAFNGAGFQTDVGMAVQGLADMAFPSAILYACGGAMLIDREVYLDVGGFDDDFFAYYEDVDLGWRLWVLGYRVALCPEAVVYHRHNGTSSRFGKHKKRVLLERNALYAVIKNYGDEALTATLPAALLLAVKRMAVRADVARGPFRFDASAPQEPPAAGMSPSGPISRARQVLRRDGWARAAQSVFARLRERLAVSMLDPERHRLVTTEAYATVIAIEDLLEHLPHLMAKRRAIQARRRRADAEVFPLFGTPLVSVAPGHAGYMQAHQSVLDALGVADLFAASPPTSVGAPVTLGDSSS
jgi:GT2 family glycosyltransferase